MRTVLGLVGFELRHHLRRISTWVYFGVLFVIAWTTTASRAGAWSEFDLGSDLLLANSPLRIATLLLTMGILAVPVTSAIAGTAVQRDFETRSYPLFFTTPTSKWAYLAGRYLGAVLTNLLVFLAVPLGIMAASASPFVEAGRVGPFRPGAYLHALGVIALPNILITAALFMVLAAVTRRMLPAYVGGFGLLVGWAIALVFAGAVEEEWLIYLVDPFGVAPTLRSTRYWTVVEQNRSLLPVPPLLLLNRALWLAAGAAVLAWGAHRFRFAHALDERELGRPGGDRRPADAAPVVVPDARREFGARARALQFAQVLRRSLREMMGGAPFYIIMAFCLLFILLVGGDIGEIYGTRTYPVTYKVLETVGGTFVLFLVIIITFYSGELVWRERDLGTHQLHDASPVPTWVPMLAKLAALSAAVALLLVAAMACGILIQAGRGYFRFELGQYLRELFVFQLLGTYLPLVVLAFAVQALASHKYVGHFAMVVYYVGAPTVLSLGFQHNLLVYASTPTLRYSDMNGWNGAAGPWGWYALFWGGVAVLLAIASNLLWPRGEERGGAWRVRLARARATRPLLTAVALAGALVLGTGGFIVYNTLVLNPHQDEDESERVQLRYEREYKRFEWVPQPRITGVRLTVELFPRAQEVRARGTYRLRNRTGARIDTVHVDVSSNMKIASFSFDRPATRVLADSAGGYYAFRLARPMLPGDSAEFRFDVALRTPGFTDEPLYGPVVENGTFLNNQVMPRIGYNPEGEITDEDVRERFGLGTRPRANPIGDARARGVNFIARDADWTDFEATVVTDADQVAVAPGYLQRTWTEGGRRHFHYRMDAPILNFYAFLSARYAVKRDRWRNVAIEVYHHPPHTYNVDRMIGAVKRSLDYFTAEFGPYQHRQVRILEFPRYAEFAQSFANTIPYSEGIGFIADVGDDDIDYPFFVTAHEVAHQWWGHQVVGADVQGAAMLSETLAEYSALMVMERQFGRAKMGRFLRYELDQYLRGRGGEGRAELPLALVEQQQYIHYNKGGLAMYALRDYIGEDRVNAALRRFLARWKFRGPPYPTSRDLIAELRAATPDSLHYLVDDLFERVILYDNRAERATWRRLPDGRYQVDLRFHARKVRADSLGAETEVPMNDLIDVGVFGADRDTPVYLAKHRVRPGLNTVRVVVRGRPERAGIDPLHKLIDRRIEDNTAEVTAP
jgi:ABC-type transport system involved in multi-copper enzyme maturation permease subunit